MATPSAASPTSLVPRPWPDTLSLVVPIYNEEPVIPLLLNRLRELLDRLPCKAEVLFVNDGSCDQSQRQLVEAATQDPRFCVIALSRNFGQQIAITAGTDFACGDAVVVMDADLQDPPELILAMLEHFRQGYDVVYAVRTKRFGETWFKRCSAAAFYWIMRRLVRSDLPKNTGDFRLMSRKVVDALRQMREQHRFLRGMVAWIGFPQIAIPFERPARPAGTTKYPVRKMLAFAWRAITSFSGLPLRMAMVAGALLMVLAAIGSLFAAYRSMVSATAVADSIWLGCLQVGLSGTMLLFMGLMGDYMARIYDELKSRPLYLIQDAVNLSWPRDSQKIEAAMSTVASPHFDAATSSRAASDPRV